MNHEKSQETEGPQADAPPAVPTAIGICQRVLRALTGVMIAAFVLIILLTTASTGPVAQVAGRSLYYVILAAAAVSLAAWAVRVRLERKAAKKADVATEAVRRH